MSLYVVVRTFSAGVHIGELVSQKGKQVVLKNARRVWSWKGANTLHEVALFGVSSGSRVSSAVNRITLTEAVEVIVATAAAEKNLNSSVWS